jgi:glycosyltransferase involved in cell wall biosynthesis/predicted negative regulator of RcsB-dependent stress response
MTDSSFEPLRLAGPDIDPSTTLDTPGNPLPKFRPEVEFQVAKLWEKKGKFERAIAGYRNVLAVAPTHWQSLAAAGELLMTQGAQTEAITLYQQAIQHQLITDQVRQATVKLQSEQIDQAIEEYQKILEAEPDHVPAHVEVLQGVERILVQKGDFDTAIAIYRQAITRSPNNAELHKRHINLVVAAEGIEAAFAYYELVRQDTKSIEISATDVLCFTAVRNELPRLPYFLDYYRQQGVARFLIVDNQSTDDALNYLRQQPDVYLWSSGKSFNQVNFGSVWFELLLRRYGIDHWCLTVDADELLYYPDCELKTIPQLCQELDHKHYRAYTAILLDMYADKAIQDTVYTSGENFLAYCSYFDRQYYHRKQQQGGPYGNQTIYFGGLRERIFGATGDYILNKVPLLKYGPEMVMSGGQHFTNQPVSKIARGSGCLLHFKYFSIFVNYVAQEVERQEHYGNGFQYHEYARTLSATPTLKLYDPNHSLKLQNSQQLVQLGILQVEPDDISPSAIEFPKILPPHSTPRPFWSVMITAYKRVNYLEQALSSVLAQAPEAEQMQIEVVNDGAPEAIQAEIAVIVERVGQGRVSFYCHAENIGHPHIFNLCLQRAKGQWVHLLHDDDWVEPGFYAAMRSGIEHAPDIGAAFCRYRMFDDATQTYRLSDLERGIPGVVPNWIERIALQCCILFPALVVKREVYETIGGFTTAANSCFDWEMWQRIALRYPVWYEPQPLASFRTHTESESHRLKQLNRQIADSYQALEFAETYLPRTTAKQLSACARESHALWALEIAKQQLKEGKYQDAIANIKKAVKQSTEATWIQQIVVRLFLEI